MSIPHLVDKKSAVPGEGRARVGDRHAYKGKNGTGGGWRKRGVEVCARV